jgi:hypothetical protein
MKIVKVLGIIAVLSIVLFQDVEVASAAETVDNIILSGNDVLLYDNTTLTITGYVLITGNATLIFSKSSVKFTLPRANITLENPAGGNPRLILSESTLESPFNSPSHGRIYIYGNSTLTATQTTFKRLEISPCESSAVTVEDSTLMSTVFASGTTRVSISSTSIKRLGSFYPRIEGKDYADLQLTKVSSDEAMYLIGKGHAKISLLTSQLPNWRIQMYENSQLYVSGGARYGTVEFYDNSKGKLNNVGLIGNIYAFESSNVELAKTATFNAIHARDNSMLILNDTYVVRNALTDMSDKIGSGLVAFDKAKILAINSNIEKAKIFDNSQATFVSTKINSAYFYNYSGISLSGTTDLISCIFADHSSGLISVKSTGRVELTVTQFGNIILKDSKVIRRLSVYDYSTVYVMDSVLQWLYAEDYTKLIIMKSEIQNYLGTAGETTTEVTESKITLAEIRDLSRIAVFSKSVITSLTALDSSNVIIDSSEVGEATLRLTSVSASFSGLIPKTIPKWGTYTNASITALGDGESPIISFANVKLTKGWNFLVENNSNVEFVDCRLNSLQTSESTVKFYNTTVAYQNLKSGSTIDVYWYLDVKAQNGTETLITIEDGNGSTIANVTMTEIQTRFILFEKTIDMTQSTFSDKYVVTIKSGGQSLQQNIQMSYNMLINTVPASFWETGWYIPVIILIAAIVIVIAYLVVRRPRRLKRQTSEE